VTPPFSASDFDYELPPERIAQEPLPERAASRLLILDRSSGGLRHAQFADVVALVAPEDVLVLNVSRVIPARLRGTRANGSAAELLLVRPCADGTWFALGHPGGKLKPGRPVTFGPDSAVEIVEMLGGGLRRIRFVGALDAGATLAKYGEVPLPPYIRRAPSDADRDGSVAAPTAGLHFTPALLTRLREQDTAIAELDLHIGPGTFKPVGVEELAGHTLHAEPYVVSDAAAGTINARRAQGGKVWAVGTTVVRALETCADPRGEIRAGRGETRLFVFPPYRFRVVDRLLTNFHLPRSTLLMLVCAFGGYEHVMTAYAEAIRHEYRFYSYGDAMAIV
jgi:S-adenosylmethionine:tRNA ribosyltransferase-isomerase